jgi:hypothetical protein
VPDEGETLNAIARATTVQFEHADIVGSVTPRAVCNASRGLNLLIMRSA